MQNFLNLSYKWLRSLINAFLADQCILRAAALTYVTALSIVPLLAVVFSISKGFGFYNTDYIKNILLELSAGREVVVEHLISYIHGTDVATLGAVGLILLLVTVFSLISNIEQSLNVIWGASYSRTLRRKFTDYLSVILICPFLVILAFSFSATMESSQLVQNLLSIYVLNSLYWFLFKIFPFISVVVALFLFYKLLPNTYIKFKSAFLGAFVASLFWQILQSVFLSYQIGVSKYNAIYGSFAQVPLFLIWLFLCWIIVLLGAEIGSTAENHENVQEYNKLGRFNIETKEKLGLATMLLLTRNFQHSESMLDIHELSRELQAPLKLVNQIMRVLIDLGFVVRGYQNDLEGYTLAVSPENLTCWGVVSSIRHYRDDGEVFVFQDQSGGLEEFFSKLYINRDNDPSLKQFIEQNSA